MPAINQEAHITYNPTLSAWAEKNGNNEFAARALKYFEDDDSFLSVEIHLRYTDLEVYGQLLRVSKDGKRNSLEVRHQEKTPRAFIMQDARELVNVAMGSICSIIRETEDRQAIAAKMLYYLQERTPALVKHHLGIKD